MAKIKTGQFGTQIGIVVVLLLLAALWSYLYGQVRELRSQYAASLVTLGKEEARIRTITDLRNLVTSTKDAREDLVHIFVTEDELIVFLDRLQEIATHAGIEFRIASAAVVDGSLVLGVEGKGSLQNNVYFLELLETLPQSLVVADVTAQDNSTDSTPANWMVSSTLKLSSFIPKGSPSSQ